MKNTPKLLFWGWYGERSLVERYRFGHATVRQTLTSFSGGAELCLRGSINYWAIFHVSDLPLGTKADMHT